MHWRSPVARITGIVMVVYGKIFRVEGAKKKSGHILIANLHCTFIWLDINKLNWNISFGIYIAAVHDLLDLLYVRLGRSPLITISWCDFLLSSTDITIYYLSAAQLALSNPPGTQLNNKCCESVQLIRSFPRYVRFVGLVTRRKISIRH